MSIPKESFASILNGERLSHDQIVRRNQLLTALLNYYMDGGRCCRKVPNWKDRLHSMKLQDLEDRYKNLFGRVL